MFTKMFKSIAALLLILPLFTQSQTIINWQKIMPSSTELTNIGHGAFISSQSNSLLISAGINANLTPMIVENLATQTKQSNNMYVYNGVDITQTNLLPELGNRAFAGTVNFYDSTIVIGGISKQGSSPSVNLLNWDSTLNKLQSYILPSLPHAASSPSAVIIENTLYVLTGSDAENKFYSLDLSLLIDIDNHLRFEPNVIKQLNLSTKWQTLPEIPLTNKNKPYQNGIKLAVQNDGNGNKIYAIGGYQLTDKSNIEQAEITAITNHWRFDPSASREEQTWQALGSIEIDKKTLNEKINSLSVLGQSHILAFTNQGKTISFNTITQSWTQYSAHTRMESSTDNSSAFISENIMTTDEQMFSLNRSTNNPSTLELWQINIDQSKKNFGWVNMTVLVIYLICVVLVGLFFVFKNRNTDDYFRGGQSIPWWAAACSIYATMLSSLTYVALPAVVYQTNWLLLIGIWMIIAVAPVAIYVAMPFFRQIDATSAYEYLSKRFNMSVRLFASGLFTLFHIGRMGIVMALTALALSAVTPLTASESVLIMGILCLIYCTMGGIEAVIWTDTLQTVVLIIGAITCFITIIVGLDGGLTDFITIGLADDKFTMIDADFSMESITTLSIWVIVLGGIGQNISSYTADQAVVQRYMVTEDPNKAKKSIWANAVIAAPGALLFFCLGTGLYVFYQLHPEKLDPTIQIDQLFPTFIATELPIGIAGLIVAGIFAAAQSTVSTSMNSIATTLVTDFIRPFKLVNTEKGYMSAARWLTFLMGALGTLAGLIFINPEIRSLMEAYFKVIGMFMGALGGLFVLGALTKKANSFGAIIGILAGVATMISAWQMGWANGYLYATIGIVSCLVIGYIASLLTQAIQPTTKDLTGLTLYTMQSIDKK